MIRLRAGLLLKVFRWVEFGLVVAAFATVWLLHPGVRALDGDPARLSRLLTGLISRSDEARAHSSFVLDHYGFGPLLLCVFAIAVVHEFAHGLACKHFGGDVPEVGIVLIQRLVPGFYCNVSDVYRIGGKRERLWVIGAGMYSQVVISAIALFAWMMTDPFSVPANGSFMVFAAGTFNLLFNCNPLIKLDGYYALAQWLEIPNLKARAYRYVRALIARVVYGDVPPSGMAASGVSPALLITYCVASVGYSATGFNTKRIGFSQGLLNS